MLAQYNTQNNTSKRGNYNWSFLGAAVVFLQSERKGDRAAACRKRGIWFDLAVLCGALQELLTDEGDF